MGRYHVLASLLNFKLIFINAAVSPLSRSYLDGNSKDDTVDKMDSSGYIPVKKGQLCVDYPQLYKTCSFKEHAQLKILVVDQLPVMATQLGCGKRMYHLLEGLVGLGHQVKYVSHPEALEITNSFPGSRQGFASIYSSRLSRDRRRQIANG